MVGIILLLARGIDRVLWPLYWLANSIPSDEAIVHKLPWLPAVGPPLAFTIKFLYLAHVW